MLPKRITKEFLDQKVESWTWLKSVPAEELIEEIEEVCKGFKFKTKPFKHQLASFLAGVYNPCFLFFLDMGLGKTKIVLDLLTYYRQQGLAKSILVVAPTSVIDTWVSEQVKEHSRFKAIDLMGSKSERMLKLTQKADIYVINFQGLQVLMTEIRKDRRKRKRVPIASLINKMADKFDSIIVDESHFIKNRTSLTFKLVNELAKTCSIRYLLSGTPMARDPSDLWSQFYVADRGESLHPNFGFFRETFFTVKPSFWGGEDWQFNKKLNLILHKKIANKSIRFRETEANDLPERLYQKILLPLPKEAAPYYSQCIDGLIQMKTGDLKVGNVFIRLRMITSGFLEFTDEDSGERQSFVFDENPKLEALWELLDSSEGKFVVFHEFIKSGEMIASMLKEKKIKCVRLFGGSKDKKGSVDAFKTDPRCRVLVANSQSGGFGLNLQVARYVVFFETPVSPIVRKQAEKRVHRTGQTKTVWIYDLAIKKSIDEKILEYLAKGEDLFQSLIEGRTKLDE